MAFQLKFNDFIPPVSCNKACARTEATLEPRRLCERSSAVRVVLSTRALRRTPDTESLKPTSDNLRRDR